MAKIYYAVLSLKRIEADELVVKLQANKQEVIAKWLGDNRADLYGETREDWKPFKDKTIREMLDTRDKVYESATVLIESLKPDFSDIGDLYDSPITLYFVDVFALYLDRYIGLANRLDREVGQHSKCCLIMPYGLSKELQEAQDQLVIAYDRLWPTVRKGYLRGKPHRIIMRADDLTNFREYLAMESIGDPNPSIMRQLTERWGTPQREVPRMGVS